MGRVGILQTDIVALAIGAASPTCSRTATTKDGRIRRRSGVEGCKAAYNAPGVSGVPSRHHLSTRKNASLLTVCLVLATVSVIKDFSQCILAGAIGIHRHPPPPHLTNATSPPHSVQFVVYTAFFRACSWLHRVFLSRPLDWHYLESRKSGVRYL